MSAPGYLVRACMDVERAYEDFRATRNPIVLKDAMAEMSRALRRAEPLGVVRYMTDEEIGRYLGDAS